MNAAAKNQAVVERLRAQIHRLQAAPARTLAVVRTRVAPFDGLFSQGGLPLGQAVELWGEAASGRTSLALRAVAAAQKAQRLCAWVDGPGELYPPAAAALGVDLTRLLIARPKAPGQLVWTAQQLLRSGAFAAVVLDLTHTGARLSLPEGKKLRDAAQQGETLCLLLTPKDAPGDGMVRLALTARGVEGLRVDVLRGAHGGQDRGALVPWDALYPGTAPVYRYVRPEAPPAPAPSPPGVTPLPLPAYERPRPEWARVESTRHRVMPCSVRGTGAAGGLH